MIEIAEDAEVIMAQPGPQELLLCCPADEIFLGGARGGGKSFGVVLFLLNRARRYAARFRALVCRQTYPELEELMSQCAEVFPLFGGRWHESKKTWTMPGGGVLKMRHLEKEKDARRFQGHQYTDVVIDEIGNFPDAGIPDILRACLRNKYGVPNKYLLTGNWGGPGHGWMRARYYDPAPPKTLVFEISKLTGLVETRVFIPAKLADNPALAKADPGYPDRIAKATRGKPYSVGYWTTSDGAPVLLSNGAEKTFPRGSLIRIGEVYGADRSDPEKQNVGVRHSPKDICIRIKDYEAYLLQNTLSGQRIAPGPADTSIWDTDRGASTASKMAAEGIHWTRANKAPGTRLLGWQSFDELLKAESDEPQFYAFEECRDFVRCVASAPCDPKNPEDVDTTCEDHALDDARYRVLNLPTKPQRRGRRPIRVAA